MKRLIWLPLAGFLLIAGAAIATAAPTVIDSARGLVAAGELQVRGGPGDLLETVLADLVDDGTITQAQSDAITSALQSAADDKRAEMEARRALIAGFVEDGVITQDEINQLPADDPLRVAFNSIADDGQISVDELRGLGPGFGPGGPGHHGRGGPFMWGPGPDAGTDPSVDSETDTSTNS